MLLLRSVTVKSRVTPGLKQELARETQDEIRRLDREIRAIEAELVDRRTPGRQGDAAARLERDKAERLIRRNNLVKRLEDIASLEPGQEVVRGQIQGLVEVKPGDRWPQILAAEIVVEDGIVLAVRDGQSVAVALGERATESPELEVSEGETAGGLRTPREESPGKEGR